MSQVQLQVRPRRSRCSTSCEPPPFNFEVGHTARQRASGAARLARAPFKALWLLLATVGRAIDAVFFLACLTVWCGLHVTAWSYAFEMGPAANCFSLPCPEWLRTKVLIGCGALAVLSFVAARIMGRLGHRATRFMLLVLLTFDVAALLLLGVRAVS